MKKKIESFGLALICFLSGVFALEPNSVETTILNVDGCSHNVVTKTYSDGLGRPIEEKLKLPPDTSTPPIAKDRVTCTFYDDAGRPQHSTKPFVDSMYAGSFLPGGLTDASVLTQLRASNKGDVRAFSETAYWDDPLGRTKSVKGPGAAYVGDSVRSWVFGVGKKDTTFDITVDSTTITVNFSSGFILSPLTPEILDGLNNYFLDHQIVDPVFTNPSYFLTVSKDLNDKYSQEIKDLFSRTLSTRAVSDPSTPIIAEYRYDILGNLLVELPPKNGATLLIDSSRSIYNTLGQLISRTTPDGDSIKYTYFDDGSIRYVTSYNSSNSIVRELRYTYDELSRPVLLKEAGPNIGFVNNEREITTWIYDDIDSVIGRNIFKNIPVRYFNSVRNTRGRLSAVIYTNYGAKKTSVGEFFSYDDEGQLSFKITAIEGITGFQEAKYEYDIHGKVTEDYLNYNGEIIKKRYAYDPLGRLVDVYHCITDDDGVTYTENLITQNNYDDLSVLTTKDFQINSQNYSVGYTYDIRDRLTGITKPPLKVGFEENIGLYDNAGNIKNAHYNYFTTAPSDTIPNFGFKMTYVYDYVNRLKTAIPTDNNQLAAFGADFSYDQAGRFISKREGDSSNLTGYQYYDMNNRLKKTSKNSAAGEEYVYDNHGNLVIDYSKRMVVEYDWRNLPVTYRFYDTIPSGITKNSAGTCTNSNLYAYMKSKITYPGTTRLLATVVMLYNAAGDRVGKLDFK